MHEDKDDELVREIRAHLELEAEERIAGGESVPGARDGARRAFGNIARIREDARAVWLPPWLDHAGQDLRYAARRLRLAPGFAISAIVILSLGIGLNIGFFQLLNAVAFRPLAVADVETLVSFDRVTKGFTSNGIPYPATQFIRQHNAVLSAVLTSSGSDVVWETDPNDRLDALYVSANWFSELGYGAVHGRLFAESVDERPDAPPVVILSHRLWQSRFSGAPVAGRTVRINNRVATIAGVAPERFPGLRLADIDVWLPIHQIDYFNPGAAFKSEWASHNTQLYGRLREGVSPEAARQGLAPTIRELARLRPTEFEPDESLVPYTGRDRFRRPRDRAELRTVGLLVSALTLTILIVACANLSNLALTHTLNRVREFSLRSALGASRWRIVRQHLIETGLVAALGAAGGLLAGNWGARLIADYIWLPHTADLTPDWRTFAAVFLIAIVALLAIGLLPASLIARRNIASALKDGGHQASRGLGRGQFRRMLIAAQVGGCCLLLIVAGSMVRGIEQMLSGDLGFEFAPVAVLDASLGRHGIGGEAADAYWREVKRQLESSSEIERVALASHAPLGRPGGRSVYSDAPALTVSTMIVEPSFFPLMRIPLVAGRNFAPSDQASSAVIISRALALGMYGTLDVVGQGFPKSGPERSIIGVAGDAHLVNVTATNAAEQYLPADSNGAAGLVLLARARGSAPRLLRPLADAARSADARVLPRTWLPSAQFEDQLRARRVTSAIAGLSGLLALALAGFGLFAVVAQNVAVRAREIGIRRALGASSASVLRVVVRQLAVPISAGAVIGVLAGVAAGTVLEGEPFFLPPTDALTPVVAVAVFTLTAISAVLVPALRALGAQPLAALRYD